MVVEQTTHPTQQNRNGGQPQFSSSSGSSIDSSHHQQLQHHSQEVIQQHLATVVQQQHQQPKITSSPRPSILRKRDHEGSPLKASKNLTSVLSTMSAAIVQQQQLSISPPPRPNSAGNDHSSGIYFLYIRVLFWVLTANITFLGKT